MPRKEITIIYKGTKSSKKRQEKIKLKENKKNTKSKASKNRKY
jgi:hypothetical protein